MTMKYPLPYEGTIGKWNMKYQKQYQGTINPRNIKYGRLYQGSIRREDFRPKLYGKIADRNNAYKYYQLPPDYYGMRRRDRVKPPSPVVANNRREIRDNVHIQQALQSRSRHGARTQERKHSVNENVDRNFTDKNRQKTKSPVQKNNNTQVKERTRPPVTAVAPTKHPPKNKPLTATYKPPDPVSPFPPASPEPRKPANRRDLRITPEPVRVRSFTDVAKPEPVFPPIMPVTLDDYVRTEHTRKVSPPRIQRNPFLPRVPPPEDSAMANLLRYSRFSPINTELRDSYDSLSRSFTNVPGYNAVGSVLRSINMYHY